MSYKLTIELSDRDLKHFRRELRRARESVGIADDEEILGAAAELVTQLRRSRPARLRHGPAREAGNAARDAVRRGLEAR